MKIGEKVLRLAFYGRCSAKTGIGTGIATDRATRMQFAIAQQPDRAKGEKMSEKRENMSKKRLRHVKTALVYYMRNSDHYHAQIARLILCYKQIKADISRLEVEE